MRLIKQCGANCSPRSTPEEMLNCEDCKTIDADLVDVTFDITTHKLVKFNQVPVSYGCPVKCGCYWRDNNDGTMSLCANNKSCGICECLPLSKLIPLYESPM